VFLCVLRSCLVGVNGVVWLSLRAVLTDVRVTALAVRTLLLLYGEAGTSFLYLKNDGYLSV
jgi:hypothetical protein